MGQIDGETQAGLVLLVLSNIAAMLGNMLVLTLAREKKFQSASHFLIFNLALGDLLVGFLTWWTYLILLVEDELLYEKSFLCVYNGVATHTFCVVSLVSVSLIAFERYFSIVKQKKKPKEWWKKVVIMVWVGVFVWTAIVAVTNPFGPTPAGTYCMSDWSRNDDEGLIVTVGDTFVCFLDFIALVVVYTAIFKEVVDTNKNATPLDRRMAERKAREVKIARKMAALVVAFFIFWTPYVLAGQVTLWTGSPASHSVDLWSFTLCQMNSAINPIVYAMASPVYRRSMKASLKHVLYLLTCGRHGQRKRTTSATGMKSTKYTTATRARTAQTIADTGDSDTGTVVISTECGTRTVGMGSATGSVNGGSAQGDMAIHDIEEEQNSHKILPGQPFEEEEEKAEEEEEVVRVVDPGLNV